MNIKRKILSILLIAGMTMVLSCSKDKTQNMNTALVTFLLGDVTFMDGDKWKPAEPGITLLEQHRLKTGDASAADVQIGDSVVRVKENSELILAALYKSELTGLEKNTLELTVGKVLVKPKKLMKGENFQVKTPTAVAGVRGTQFVVEASEARNTRVSVLEGKVKVSKRIKALEEIESSSVKDDAVIRQIEQKVEENSVTVGENTSAEVDAGTVDEANGKVEKIVKEVEKRAALKEESAREKAEKTETGTTVKDQKKTPEGTVENELAEVDVLAQKAITTGRADRADMALKKEFDEIKKVELPKEEKPVKKTPVTINPEPSDAVVRVNEETIGAGSTTMNLLPGKYTITVSLNGYKTVTRQVKVGEDPVEETVSLDVAKSDVRFNVNPANAKVYIDGELTGSGSVTTSLVPGEHTLNVKAPGYEDLNTRITVKKGESLEKAVRLQMMRVGWSLRLDSPAENMTYDDTTMYISSRDRTVRAVSRSSAKTTWKRTIPTVVSSGFVTDGKNLYFGTADQYFYMLNAGNGKTAWKKELNGAVINDASPVITPNTVYVASSRGTVYAFGKRGNLKWKKELSAGVMESPVLAGGTLYCAAQDGVLYAMDADGGSIQWKSDIGQRFKMAYGDDTIAAVSYYGKVKSISADTGKVQWEKKLDGTYIVNPFISGNTLFMASLDGTIMAMESTNGDRVFRTDINQPVRHDITLAGGSLYVSAGNTLYTLNKNGKVTWKYNTGAGIGTSALVSGNRVYVGLDNGRVMSINRKL